MAALDAEEDGDRDLITGLFAWMTNTGAAWLPAAALNPPVAPPAPPGTIDHGFWHADLDRDGDLDAIEVRRSSSQLYPPPTLVSRVLEWTGPATVVQVGPIHPSALPFGDGSSSQPAWRLYLEPVDFDGDGRLALLGANTAWLNTGGLSHAAMSPPLYSGMVPLAAGDLDGDLDPTPWGRAALRPFLTPHPRAGSKRRRRDLRARRRDRSSRTVPCRSRPRRFLLSAKGRGRPGSPLPP